LISNLIKRTAGFFQDAARGDKQTAHNSFKPDCTSYSECTLDSTSASRGLVSSSSWVKGLGAFLSSGGAKEWVSLMMAQPAISWNSSNIPVVPSVARTDVSESIESEQRTTLSTSSIASYGASTLTHNVSTHSGLTSSVHTPNSAPLSTPYQNNCQGSPQASCVRQRYAPDQNEARTKFENVALSSKSSVGLTSLEPITLSSQSDLLPDNHYPVASAGSYTFKFQGKSIAWSQKKSWLSKVSKSSNFASFGAQVATVPGARSFTSDSKPSGKWDIDIWNPILCLPNENYEY
jgi:hypothetical protein